MNARQARILAGSALLPGILLAAGVAPAAGADCALSAPQYVNVGTPIKIDGAGFPPSTDVEVKLSITGGPSDAFTVQSDAAGALQIALTPEEIDIGVTRVLAAAGSTCTASVTYTVLAAGATPPPAPTEKPASRTGSEPSAPGTDLDTEMGGGGGSTSLLWALALVVVGAGSGGLCLTRSPRRR